MSLPSSARLISTFVVVFSYIVCIRRCSHPLALYVRFFFFFTDTATTEIYPLSLHDALPISDEYARIVEKVVAPEQDVKYTIAEIGVAPSGEAG